MNAEQTSPPRFVITAEDGKTIEVNGALNPGNTGLVIRAAGTWHLAGLVLDQAAAAELAAAIMQASAGRGL